MTWSEVALDVAWCAAVVFWRRVAVAVARAHTCIGMDRSSVFGLLVACYRSFKAARPNAPHSAVKAILQFWWVAVDHVSVSGPSVQLTITGRTMPLPQGPVRRTALYQRHYRGIHA